MRQETNHALSYALFAIIGGVGMMTGVVLVALQERIIEMFRDSTEKYIYAYIYIYM